MYLCKLIFSETKKSFVFILFLFKIKQTVGAYCSSFRHNKPTNVFKSFIEIQKKSDIFFVQTRRTLRFFIR